MMRLVDISLSDISGQAADIKGNLNIVGHVLLVAINKDVLPFISGYFEVDGSTVLNAKANYPKLQKLLKNQVSAGFDLAALENDGDNIKLGHREAFLAASDYSVQTWAGKFNEAVHVPHFHRLHSPGGEIITDYQELTISTPQRYTIRLFIYHGVHK